MSSIDSVLIVGGGPAGLRAAVDLAEMGFSVVLVERRAELGGAPIRWKYHTLAPDMRPTEEVMSPLIDACKSNQRVRVYTSSVVSSFSGSLGEFSVEVKGADGSSSTHRVGAIIVATGFEHFDARVDPRYAYGRAPDVIGINELEGMLRTGKITRHDGSTPKRIGFVFCVGSRDRSTNPWCCTVCCGVSIKQAIELRRLLPDSQIYMIYMDIRTWGLWEKLYWDSMEKYGINYIRGRVGEVYFTGEKLLVKGEDTRQAARVFGLSLNEYGFLKPRQPNIHFDSGVDGVFLAGACVAPMSIEEALEEGSAAAMQAAKLLMRRSKQKVPPYG